jgi:tetratricopeptide (TPR) repeat protein
VGTAACGIGSSWFGTTSDQDECNDDIKGRRKEDYQIQDLIWKISNVPFIKSTTCKTLQTDEVTEFSDEENTPVVARKKSLQESYPPYGRPEQVASCLDSTRDAAVGRNTQTEQNHKRRPAKSQRLPRQVYPESRPTSQDDEISSLAATAANEILDCMDAGSGPSFLLPYSNKHSIQQPQRTNSIVASCLTPTVMDVPTITVNSTIQMPSKSLFRASFPAATGTNSCLPAGNSLESHGMSSTTRMCGQAGQASSSSSPRSLAFQNKVQREIQYWFSRLDHIKQYQKTKKDISYSRKAADLHFHLGQAYMKNAQYDLAMEHFSTAQTQWQHIHRSQHHVAVARALDAMGLALLRQAQPPSASSKQPSDTKTPDRAVLSKAQQVLQQAFAIRFHQLGVWHVDTVETYNKLASVHLHMGELREACHAYHQVFLVRRAIFGGHHPSVAISAHSLANVYYKMQMNPESLKWYATALKIYREDLHLSHSHPTVAKLLKDRSRLGDSF